MTEKSSDARALFDLPYRSDPAVKPTQTYPLKHLFHDIDTLLKKCIVRPVAFQLLYEWKREKPVRCSAGKHCF